MSSGSEALGGPPPRRVEPALLVQGQRGVRVRVPAAAGERRLTLLDARGRVVAELSRGLGSFLTGRVDRVGGTAGPLSVAPPRGAPTPAAARITAEVEIALTFDDGPSVEADDSTARVLDVLGERGLVAAFFVLTGPDVFRHWLFGRRTYPKAETPRGFELLVREAREGHVLGVHWGGAYASQHVTHPRRLTLPPYDADGDGHPEGSCALATDLLACARRIREALAAAGRTDPVDLVRSPLWIYASRHGDARPVYHELGLRRVGTDACLFDGGYPGAGYTWTRALCRGLEAALRHGIATPVVTMHDSNPRTARDLPAVLTSIARRVGALGIEPGTWRFLTDRARLANILGTRTDYALG